MGRAAPIGDFMHFLCIERSAFAMFHNHLQPLSNLFTFVMAFLMPVIVLILYVYFCHKKPICTSDITICDYNLVCYDRSTATTYAKQNGGQYDFFIEPDNHIALPMDKV